MIPEIAEFTKINDPRTKARTILNNPLLFWNSDYAKQHFKRVQQVALRILSIPVSSVDPERLFSILKIQ